MCPCNPSDNELNPGQVPGLPIPGFGLPFAPIQVPIPGFKFPDGFPESILDILDYLKINWPGGQLSPQIDNFATTILKAVMDLLGMILPFLSFYNFILAALNMILCIMDVLCALSNPFKLIRALRRLFKSCLPAFLNLFPWAALIAMIISLILLLIALLEYIIARILEIFNDIIENLKLLARGTTLQDAESTVATAYKIGSLLCIIENLLAMLSAIAVIFAIVNALSETSGRHFCGGGSGDGVSSDCCGDDVCPPFIRNNPDGISGTSGRLVYYNQIVDPTRDDNPMFRSLFKGLSSNTVRQENWQFVNDDTGQAYPFTDIITQYKDTSTDRGNVDGNSRSLSEVYEYGDIFWPEGITFDKNSSLRKTPYFVDFTLENLDLSVFNTTAQNKNARTIIIRSSIVESKPYVGLKDESGVVTDTSSSTYGTLSLAGGLAYESDGTTPVVDSSGNQITLDELVHLNYKTGSDTPSYDDGYHIGNINFTLNINHASLMDYNLTVAGCVPDIAIETQQLNDRFADIMTPVITRVGEMPDITGTQSAISDIIATLRTNVTEDTAATARDDIVEQLNGLKSSAEDTFKNAFYAGADPYYSDVSLDTDLQFTDKEIVVTVVLKDRNGVNLSQNIPDSVASDIESGVAGEVTLGEISDFTYDSDNGVFTAQISSESGGDGEVKVSWNNNIFQEILNEDDVDKDTSVQEKALAYTFIGVGAGAITGGDGSDSGMIDGQVRRDVTDVTNNSSENK